MLHFRAERADEWYILFVNTKLATKISRHGFRWCVELRWTGWEKTRGDGMHSTRTSTALFV